MGYHTSINLLIYEDQVLDKMYLWWICSLDSFFILRHYTSFNDKNDNTHSLHKLNTDIYT